MVLLYVGDLESDTTEVVLFEKFSTVGPVVSIRICRDMVTRRSLGHAYVNFQQLADAERALHTMNFDMIKGRPCRIMWSQRVPSLRRKSGVGCLFIKNLDKAIDNKALYDTFSTFGNILSCKVVTDEHGASKGYGFVRYETKESGDMAIEKVNGMLLNDKKVFVGKLVPRKEREKQLSIGQRFTNIYVKNFGKDFTETQLKELFLPYGNIVSQRVMLDDEGRPRGFGFISFDSYKSAACAVKDLNGKMMPNGKHLYCNRAQKRSERLFELRHRFDAMTMKHKSRYEGVNLYVKNFDDEIDDERLRTEFAKFGNITSVKVMRHDNGESKGFGFVCFTTPEEATKAILEMNGRTIVTKPLFVALAQRKKERQAQLAAQHKRQRGSGRIQASKMKPQTGFYPMPYKQNQRAFPVQQRRGRGNVPCASISSRMGARTNNPPTRHTIDIQQLAQNQGVQQTAAKLKFKANTRNQPGGIVAGSQGGDRAQGIQITTSELSAATPQQQKQLLGDQLFHLITQMHPKQAGKITGMLLEMDNSEILHMLDSHESLKLKVDEAVMVLKAHQEKQQLHQQAINIGTIP